MSQYSRLAYVLLAAGGSSRFGKCKQLATIDFKETILERSLNNALGVSPGEVFLVLGANRELIDERLNLEKNYPRVNIVINELWQDGVASSIVAGINQLDPEEYKGVMILLADQIAIKEDQLKELREAWYAAPDKITASEYKDTLGAPAIFPSSYFDRLRGLMGDKGAKWLINEEHANVVRFPLKEAQWDIDTENQLNNWQFEAL